MILILLFRARYEIMQKKKNKGKGDGPRSIQSLSVTGGFDDMERMLQAEDTTSPKPSYLFTEEISFLYEAYKPEYWYWEVRASVIYQKNHMVGWLVGWLVD